MLSLVETFIELKYFHDVATPALLCHERFGALERKMVLDGIRDRWLPCTERSYYGRPCAIKNQQGSP